VYLRTVVTTESKNRKRKNAGTRRTLSTLSATLRLCDSAFQKSSAIRVIRGSKKKDLTTDYTDKMPRAGGLFAASTASSLDGAGRTSEFAGRGNAEGRKGRRDSRSAVFLILILLFILIWFGEEEGD